MDVKYVVAFVSIFEKLNSQKTNSTATSILHKINVAKPNLVYVCNTSHGC